VSTRIERFLDQVRAYGGTALRAADPPSCRSAVAGLLAAEGVETLCWWEGDPLVAAIEPATLAREAPPAQADAGLTGVSLAVAETGTLALAYGSGRSRRSGLLPDLHVALVPAERIVDSLAEATAALYADPTSPPRAVTLVTGPSATSDIEKIRVVGVHGPRRMAVVVVG
jgi:L-lactate dehydrogenase complex protein LldG